MASTGYRTEEECYPMIERETHRERERGGGKRKREVVDGIVLQFCRLWKPLYKYAYIL